MEWALIILKTLSARIDFHFLRLCNGSCNTADPKSRYLVISLHGSRRDELKIARHWPWTCQKSEKWQWGSELQPAVPAQRRGRLLCGCGSTRGQSSTRDYRWSSWCYRSRGLCQMAWLFFSPPPPPLKIGEMLARRAADSQRLTLPSAGAWKYDSSKRHLIVKYLPNGTHR